MMSSTSSNKRRNENAQVRKDEWETMNNDSGNNEEGNHDSFRAASHQELQQRRIIRATLEPAGRSSIGSTTAGTGNPFGGIQLLATVTGATPAANNKNPFASVSLIAPTTATTTSANLGNKDLHGSENTKNLKLAQKLLKVSQTVLTSVIRDSFAPVSFPSTSFTEEELGHKKDTSTTASTNTQSSLSTASTSAKPSSSTFAGFTFATPVTTNTSINHNEQPKSQPSTALSNSSSSNALSFLPAANNIANKETTSIARKKGAEDEEFKKEEAEVAEKEINEEEDTLYEVRVKHYKLVSEVEWKNFGIGTLRLMQSKTNPQKFRRMVVRSDVIGTVQLNVAIGKGMPFVKEPQNKTNTGLIRFVNPADGGQYMFKVRGIDTLEKFHSMLTDLAK